MALDFAPMEAAGVTQTEFASILSVTRVTVNRWARGVTPTPYLTKAATNLMSELQAAVDAGLLPGALTDLVPNRYNLEERRAIIDSALETVRKDG